MSGFAGYICEAGELPDEKVLQSMAQQLAFRGPDGTHLYAAGGMSACFTFLRTGPAPQSEKQPCSLDGTNWLIGEVRLDDREELREALERGGESIPADASCEELALYAWQQWGKESFARLDGDFAFAVWDPSAKRMLCARDLMGSRPFFYAQSGARFYFSNTLDAIRAAPEISSAIDPHFIGDFLLQGWCPDAERTAFRDIRRLPPGHLLEFANGEAKIRRFATLPIEEPLWRKYPEEYVEEFRAHFRNAVADRLPRSRATVFLSGGLDSTSVAAQAVLLTREKNLAKLRAVTLDCRPLFEDEEAVLAGRAAEYWGIPIDIVSLEKEVSYGNSKSERFRAPEPSAEPFPASQLELYRRAAAHASVALSGDGGDEILTGQARSYLGYLLRRGNVVTLISELGGYVVNHRRMPFLGTGLRGKLRKWLGKKESELVYPGWIEPNFEKEMQLRERWKTLNRPAESSKHPVHPEAYASLMGTYWSRVLEDEDAAWTGVAVEARAPFLDLRLIRFLLRVPPLPWCMQKELLREATRGIMPEEIRLRPKVPLIEDPLPLLMERGSRSTTPLVETGAKSRSYVNWLKVPTTSIGDAGYVLIEKMRPAALEHWLKGVEKHRGIQ